MKKLANMTVGELKLLAREQGIDTKGFLKHQIVYALEESDNMVITSRNTAPGKDTGPSAATNENGVLISPQPEVIKNKRNIKEPTVANKVAVYAEKNLYWPEAGRLEKGFNFVTREVADKWLTLHRSVREASPEEVAAYYNK